MNVPNSLSLARICLIPFFVATYLLPYEWGVYVSVGIFLLCCFTDFLDGFIARKYNMVTDLGKLLDPIADKILICAALFCVVATNPLQYYCNPNVDVTMVGSVNSYNNYVFNWGLTLLTVGAILILARELLISGVRMIAASKGMVVQANIFGKIKTILQDVSLPMLMLSQAQGHYIHKLGCDLTSCAILNIVRIIGIILFLLAIVMTIVSGVIYLVQNRGVFKQEQTN